MDKCRVCKKVAQFAIEPEDKSPVYACTGCFSLVADIVITTNADHGVVSIWRPLEED